MLRPLWPLAYRSFLDQLSTLLASGIPILQALANLGRSPHGAVAVVAKRLGERIQGGLPLAEAMGREPCFPPAHVALIGAAERAGAVPAVLLRLRDEVDRGIAARRAFAMQAAYPLLVLALAALLPPIKLIVEGHLGSYIALEVGIFGAAGAAAALLFAYRKRLFPLLTKLPFLGGAIRRAALGESISLLGLLVGAGIGVREALGITAESARFPALSEDLKKAARAIEGGRNLAGSLESLTGLPFRELGSIASGEHAGSMDRALEAAGRDLEESARRAIGRFLTALPVAIYIFAVVLVGILYINAMLQFLSL